MHNSQVLVNKRRITTPISFDPPPDVSVWSHRPIGIIGKVCQREQDDDHWEIDLSDREMDMLYVVSVFFSCVTKLKIIEGLKKMNLKQIVLFFDYNH